MENKMDRKSVHNDTMLFPVVLNGLERDFYSGQEKRTPSCHNYFELSYCRSGSIEFTAQNQKYLLQPGSTLIIKRNVEHTYVIPNKKAEIVTIYFSFNQYENTNKPDLSFYAQAASRNAYVSRSQDKRSSTSKNDVVIKTQTLVESSAEIYQTDSRRIADQSLNRFMAYIMGEDNFNQSEPCLMVKGRGCSEIQTLAETIIRESEAQEYGKKIYLNALAVQLLILAIRAMKEEWEESLKVKSGNASELVHIACRFIEENYHKSITVSDAASYVFLSKGYFARAFREEFGQGPTAYLTSIRLQKACELLKERDIKIRAISDRVGFSSPQRFNAAFRRELQMTPIEYRRRIQTTQTD